MAEIDDLVREVQEANTVMESAATLIAGLRDQIRANIHNPTQLASLARSLDEKANALQAAIGSSPGSPDVGEPVPLPPPTPVDQGNAGAGTMPTDAAGNPVQLDASGAPISPGRPNDPLTGQPVPDKPVAGAEGSTAPADAAAQPGAQAGTSQPVAPMTTTGTGAAIATSSPAQPADASGSTQPKATP